MTDTFPTLDTQQAGNCLFDLVRSSNTVFVCSACRLFVTSAHIHQQSLSELSAIYHGQMHANETPVSSSFCSHMSLVYLVATASGTIVVLPWQSYFPLYVGMYNIIACN